LSEADVALAIEKSEHDLCSVAASLRAAVAIESSFVLTST
jgi:uncharacterized OsmC-like protein